MRRFRNCALLVAVVSILIPVNARADNTNSPLGVNFWNMGWDNQFQPFLDYFCRNNGFWSQPVSSTSPWDDKKALTLDKNGYPASLQSGQAAVVLVFPGTNHPVGRVLCLYDGDGDIAFAWNNPTEVSRTAGRIVLNLAAGNYDIGFLLKITRTNSQNPIRNIRLIQESQEQLAATQIWQPRFLELLAPFRCLRFMDWMNANGSAVVNWADRTTPQSATQCGVKGICLEYMIDLCNKLNADPWFCLPYAANDDYYRSFATMAKSQLNANLKAYYEYSNEVWNGGVSQGAGFCTTLGEGLGFSGWAAQHHGWAKRMTEMLTVVEGVYAGQMNRLVRVIATQIGNTGVADGLLNYYGGKSHADVLAIAPYLRPTGSDVNTVINALTTEAASYSIRGDSSQAKQNGLRLVAYEAGMELYSIAENLREQVRFDSRMSSILTTYFSRWKAGGGTLMNYYTFSSTSWGLVKDLQPNAEQAAPYQAALAYMNANPRWWTETRDSPTELLEVASDRQVSLMPQHAILGLTGFMPRQPGVLTFAPDGRFLGSVQGIMPNGVYVKKEGSR